MASAIFYRTSEIKNYRQPDQKRARILRGRTGQELHRPGYFGSIIPVA
jgi:hypothetical protein